MKGRTTCRYRPREVRDDERFAGQLSAASAGVQDAPVRASGDQREALALAHERTLLVKGSGQAQAPRRAPSGARWSGPWGGRAARSKSASPPPGRTRIANGRRRRSRRRTAETWRPARRYGVAPGRRAGGGSLPRRRPWESYRQVCPSPFTFDAGALARTPSGLRREREARRRAQPQAESCAPSARGRRLHQHATLQQPIAPVRARALGCFNAKPSACLSAELRKDGRTAVSGS